MTATLDRKDPPPHRAVGSKTVGVLVLGLLALAGLTAGLLAAFAPSLSLEYGLPPADVLVEAGLPAARVLAVGASAGVVGCLLLAAVLVPGDAYGVVTPLGYAGLRATRWCALLQVVASVVIAALTVVENSGLSPQRLLGSGPALVVGLEQIQPATGWLLSGFVALLVSLLAGWVLAWRGAVGLLVLALAGLLPAALTAATNAQRSHDIAGDSLAIHVLGAVLWLGSAVATSVALSRDADPHRRVVVRRHSHIATWSLVGVGASGVISSAYAIAPSDLLSTGYGRLVLLSCVLLVLLAAVGARVRSATLRAWSAGSARRVLALELVLLAAVTAVGTGLTRLAPPIELGYQASRDIYLLGYDLPGHLTAFDLIARWRPDLVFGPLAVISAVLYLLGVRRLRRAGQSWPIHYTGSWLVGCAVVLVATSSGIGTYASAVFSLHMVQHMLLATFAPTLLVLGHGATLATRASSAATAHRLTSLLDASAVRVATHPITAWIAVAVTLFGLYPTGLFAAILQQHWAHLSMNAAFFCTGLALFWSVLGRSRPQRRLPAIGQIVIVFAVMGLHAGFSAWLLGQPAPIAEPFYRALQLPFVPDLLADQRLGAILGWVLGELPVVAAVLALILRWSRDDRAPTGLPAWRTPPEPASPN